MLSAALPAQTATSGASGSTVCLCGFSASHVPLDSFNDIAVDFVGKPVNLYRALRKDRKGDQGAAASLAEDAVRLAPNFVQTRVAPAVAYLRNDNFEAAEEQIHTAPNPDPSYLPGPFNLWATYDRPRSSDLGWSIKRLTLPPNSSHVSRI